jgi:hypothetical protein
MLLEPMRNTSLRKGGSRAAPSVRVLYAPMENAPFPFVIGVGSRTLYYKNSNSGVAVMVARCGNRAAPASRAVVCELKIDHDWELAVVAKQKNISSDLLRGRATRRCAVLTHG